MSEKQNELRSYRWAIVVLSTALLVSLTFNVWSSRNSESGVSRRVVELTRVVDGDTIVISVDGWNDRVRFIGVNTPEEGKCGYKEASSEVERLLKGKSLLLVSGVKDNRDKYGRVLRYVEADGIDVGLSLIKNGLAKADYDSQTVNKAGKHTYDAHPREASYRLADSESPSICGTNAE